MAGVPVLSSMLAGVTESHGSDFIRALKRVRQIRDFRPETVPDDVLRDILDVARWTGSGRNQQPWSFVVIRDPATRARIAEIGAPQTAHVGRAPLAVAVVMAGRGAVIDAYDEGRVAERILIAAEALGLGAGIGWIRSDIRKTVNDLLGVADPGFVRTIVSLGYPSEAGLEPKSAPGTARKPLDELVHEERLS